MSAPDVCGEGQVVCPCGKYVARFDAATVRTVLGVGYQATYASIRTQCPHCHLLIEVWRP